METSLARTLSISMLPRSISNESWATPSRRQSRALSDTTAVGPDPLPSSQNSAAMIEQRPTPPTDDHFGDPLVEESLEDRIKRLGKERPPAFKTGWQEVTFVFSIVMSQIITEFFVSGFTVILPVLVRELKIPQAQQVWPATAFSLVIASTLLVFGRFGDMWGGYPVYIWGLAWLLLWSIIAGFSINPLMMDFCRALQGLGAAAFLPTGVMLMGTAYRPGPRKNLVFAIYGTFAVLGFYSGIFAAGMVGQYIHWGWYFWIGSFLTALTLAASIFSISNDRKERMANQIQMDWLGTATIVSGLVLVVFAITESAHAEHRWRTPYIPALFVVGMLLLILAIYIEGWIADMPLLPADLFDNPSMAPLVIAMMLLYGTWGIYILYGTFYFLDIMGTSSLQLVAWYAPTAIGGLVFSLMEGLILHIVPGRVLLVISAAAALGAQLLLALNTPDSSYWRYVFPSAILATIGIDLSYNLMTVFITTTLPASRQGLGGGLINSVLQLGIAFLLGFSDITQSYTKPTVGLERSYKNTFWMGVAAAGTSLILMAIWGKVPKAESELTADERAELTREATRGSMAETRSEPGGGSV